MDKQISQQMVQKISVRKAILSLDDLRQRTLVFAIIALLLAVTAVGINRPAFAQDDETDATAEETLEFPAEPGLLIASVPTDSPAAQAGIVRGDILLSVNDVAVNSIADLHDELQTFSAGDEISVTVLHGDDERTLAITLGESGDNAFLGVVPCNMGSVIIDQRGRGFGPDFDHEDFEHRFRGYRFGMPNFREFEFGMGDLGARIMEIVPESPAAQAGLQEDDVIVAINDESLEAGESLGDLIAAFAPGETITLGVDRSTVVEEQSDTGEESIEVTVERIDVEVTLGENPDEAGKAFLGVRYAPFIGLGGFDFEHLPDGDFRKYFGDRLGPDFEERFRERFGDRFGDRFERRYERIVPKDSLPEGFDEFHFEIPEGVETGVIVMNVLPDSPADEAGINPGDVLVAINGEAIDTPEILVEMVSEMNPGEEVTLSVHSADGEVYDVMVTLSEIEDGRAVIGVAIDRLFENEDE
ncbi:PDZ domain-containing protein [Chloroflexi bacterium TSY]|nr:PDZ domain-containing protein [Chloroflexi bacterium TSY]